MSDSRSFQIITDFVAMLRRRKGEVGRVELRAHHWPHATNARDVGTRKKVITAGSPVMGTEPRRFDGVLEIGEILEFVATSPRSGFVHLFDFGTSGTVLKLGPSVEYPQNRVEANVEFTIPSPLICPLPNDQSW
jgi:hypothetical protein